MRLLQASLLTAVLLALTGCGVQGKWVTDRVEPETAADHFNMGEINLMDDGTYTAVADYGKGMETSTGKWEYSEGKLTFIADDGDKRVYDAELTNMGNMLKVMSSMHGQMVTTYMKRD